MTIDKPMMRFVSAAVSDKGLSEKRPVNEDSYLEMVERGLFAVADGVGGAQAGDVASQMAMETLYEAFSHPQPNVDTEELMEMAIQRANQSIFQMARELPQLDMMATTIVTLHLDGNIATIGHVGDSRLYRLDLRGNLFRETQDHSVVEEEVRAGRMTLAQAANHPSRNVISRALGADQTVEVDMKTIMFEPGTTFLLCSDGVTRHVEDTEMRDLLMRFAEPVEACRELKNICYSRGAEDNLTAVVVRIQESEVAAAFPDDDEATLATARPAAVSANGSNPVEPARAEVAVLNSPAPIQVIEEQPLVTTKLEPAQELLPVEPPAYETLQTTEYVSPSGVTMQSKIDNERLRAKVDSAAPPERIADTPKRGGVSLGWLLPLLIGALLGAAGLYAWYEYQRSVNPPPVQQPVQQQPAASQNSAPPTSDLSAAEINEFRTFERTRRAVDDNPGAAPNAAAPQTAADHYLRARAYLQIGKNEEALQSLREAEKMLPQTADVDRETLRVDTALAYAALAAMANNGSQKKMLTDLIADKKTGQPPTAEPVR